MAAWKISAKLLPVPFCSVPFHSMFYNFPHHLCVLVLHDIVSAIGISAKNIGISYRQYNKMHIGNQNLTFLWENWP